VAGEGRPPTSPSVHHKFTDDAAAAISGGGGAPVTNGVGLHG